MSTPRREPLSFALIATCFFGSGLTALVYELLWTRRLQETFGSTTYSVTTVLAAYMAGLGLGSYLIGRRVDRSARGGLQIYALLELGVGIYALLSLPLLSVVEQLFAAIQSRLQLGQEAAALLKLLLSFPALALPAGLMGGTLPALVRGLLTRRAALPVTVGRLYGINTAGAALGTALTGLLLIEVLGLWCSMVLAALVNLSIGALVLSRLRRQAPDTGADTDADAKDEAPRVRLRRHLRRPAVLFCAVAVVLTGLLSMLYEIVWTRMLSLVFGSSTYAFTIVLATFLCGIAFGALIYSRLARRSAPTVFGLTLALLALALWAVITLVSIPALPGLVANVAQIPGVSFLRVLLLEVLFALLLLLVPTLLLGAALPMSMGIISRSLGQAGRDVGGIYLVNTLGSIAGSVLTGFLLIPLIGTRSTLLAGLVANLALVGVGVIAFAGTRRLRILGATVVLLSAAVALSQPPWPAKVFDSGLGYRMDELHADTPLKLFKALHRFPNRLLSRAEGRNATITVRQFRRGVTLLVNGKPDASTSADMHTQVVLGIVAAAAHPAPRDVAVVGWGSGVTTYTFTFFPEIRRVDTIEIEPEVLAASRFFHGVNGRAERQPRVHVVFDDARSFFLTTNRTYDLVVSEPSNPWMAGTSALFSRDYYRLAKQRLREGGVFGQWLQLYRMDSSSIALILRTVSDSFADVQLWASDPYNVILLGSDRPIRVTRARVTRAYQKSARLRRHMAAYGPGVQPGHLFGCFLLDREGIGRIVRRFPDALMTDDRPILEYRALRNLYGTHQRHIDALLEAKLRLGRVVPPGSGASPGLALAGAATLLRSLPEWSERIARWGLGRFGDGPQLQLARATALVHLGDLPAALALTRRLPPQPAFQAEAALLEAQVLLRQGRPVEALGRLEQMGPFRPVARLVYQLEGALAARRWDLGWTYAEQLLGRLDQRPWEIDARQVQRSHVYEQVLELTRRSGAWRRAIQLIGRREEPCDGELDRLWALTNAYWATGQRAEAVRAMDRVLAFNDLTEGSLRLCVQIHRAAGNKRTARQCERMLLASGLAPTDRRLFE